MPFCPNCGAGVSGPLCEKCGAAQPVQPEVALTGAIPAAAVTLAPPATDFSEVATSAIRDAWKLLQTNRMPAIVLIVIATICGVAALLGVHDEQTRYNAVVLPIDILAIVLTYFAVAAAVRTLRPEFRMTVGTWFAFFGYTLLVALLAGVASLAFVIPGIWVAIKLELAPYVYLLEPGAKPIERSWHMTTGQFWETFALLLIVGIAGGIAAMLGVALMFIAVYAPLAGIILIPIGLVPVAWALHVQALGLVRWTNALLAR